MRSAASALSSATQSAHAAGPALPDEWTAAGLTVYLITVLYKSETGLPLFLKSLQAQHMGNWRLYAIDNASPDASGDRVEAMAARDSRIKLHRNKTNTGFSKATNQGLRAAVADGGQVFILINNDTAFAPDFL